MPRILTLLLLLPLVGCQQSSIPAKPLQPVVVDEAAAYPAQDLGTKPPILTGFTPLSKELLDEGWVQLFDGISTFGWEVSEGEGTLSVMSDGTKNYFVLDNKNQEKVFIVHHRFCKDIKVEGDCIRISGLGPLETHSATKNGLRHELRGKPSELITQPLTESDWHPAAGASEAKWSNAMSDNYCLELTGGSGMVETVKEYGDFILQLEYFTEKGINSGVFFRCIPGENMNGYECQILNTPSDNDYESFIGTDTGGIFRRQVGRNVGPKDGEWNYLTVAARGPHIATWVNGIQVTDWTDPRDEHDNPRNGKRLKPGTIQLQGHDPETKIQFRNFRIAEIL